MALYLSELKLVPASYATPVLNKHILINRLNTQSLITTLVTVEITRIKNKKKQTLENLSNLIARKQLSSNLEKLKSSAGRHCWYWLTKHI